MSRFSLAASALVTAVLGTSLSALAIPAVGSLEIDFRTSSWQVNGTQTSKTVGNVTAQGYRSTLLFGVQATPLTQSGTDGLGINGPVGDDGEIGVAEILRLSFANGAGNSAGGAWVTRLFADEFGYIDESGYVELYVGGNLLKTVNFVGTVPSGGGALGDVYVNFDGFYDLSEARFFSSGTLLNGVFVNDYAVAGLKVPDHGMTLGLLGIGLVGLGAVRRRLA